MFKSLLPVAMIMHQVNFNPPSTILPILNRFFSTIHHPTTWILLIFFPCWESNNVIFRARNKLIRLRQHRLVVVKMRALAPDWLLAVGPRRIKYMLKSVNGCC